MIVRHVGKRPLWGLGMKSNDMSRPTMPATAPSLDRHYGKIGILAVAAALRYRGDAKNPAYAPVVLRHDDRRFAELAA